MRHCSVRSLVRKMVIYRSTDTDEPLQQRRTKGSGEAIGVHPLVVIQVVPSAARQFPQVGTASVSTYAINFPASSLLGSKASFSSAASVIAVEL